MTDEKAHRAAVVQAIHEAQAQGKVGFGQILQSAEGADPRLVAECLADAKNASPIIPLVAPVPSQELLIRLPAADPVRSQWWFTGETVLDIAKRAIGAARGTRILCLGTPTVAHELISSNANVLL